MLPWLLSKWSWKSFAVGAGAAIFGGTIARPAIVEVVKAGMGVQDQAVKTFDAARQEFQKIREEAAQQRAGVPADSSALLAELQKMRAEIAALRTSQSHS